MRRTKAIGRQIRGTWVRKLHGWKPDHFRISMTTPQTTHSTAMTAARPANQVNAVDSAVPFLGCETPTESSVDSRSELSDEFARGEEEVFMASTVPFSGSASPHEVLARCIIGTSGFRAPESLGREKPGITAQLRGVAGAQS